MKMSIKLINVEISFSEGGWSVLLRGVRGSRPGQVALELKGKKNLFRHLRLGFKQSKHFYKAWEA